MDKNAASSRFVWQPGDIEITPPKGKAKKRSVALRANAVLAAFGALAADCDDHCTSCSACRAKNLK